MINYALFNAMAHVEIKWWSFVYTTRPKQLLYYNLWDYGDADAIRDQPGHQRACRSGSKKIKGKVFYGQEPPSGEYTTTECGVNYQLLAVIYWSSPMGNS